MELVEEHARKEVLLPFFFFTEQFHRATVSPGEGEELKPGRVEMMSNGEWQNSMGHRGH